MQTVANRTTGSTPPPTPVPQGALKQAIKDYQDEQLTGLTDEERAKIEKLKKEYLEKNKVETKNERDLFEGYIKSLLKKFGYKGDIEAFAKGVGTTDDESKEETDNAQLPPKVANPADYYQKGSAEMAAVRAQFFS